MCALPLILISLHNNKSCTYVYLLCIYAIHLFCILIISAASSGSGRLQIALNLDLRDGTEETAIGLALWTGQFDVARELLEAGKLHKNPRRIFNLLYKLLHVPFCGLKVLNCVYINVYTKSIEHFVIVGADIEAPNSQQQTLLYLAVIREQPKACLFLIESGADYRKKSVCRELYLHTCMMLCSHRLYHGNTGRFGVKPCNSNVSDQNSLIEQS